LRDYDAISITPIRNERYKTTILVGTTSAFDAVGELDRQLLRTFAGRTLITVGDYLAIGKAGPRSTWIHLRRLDQS
jgi:hypothetical protein